MNIIFGAPYKVDKYYGTKGLYMSILNMDMIIPL